MKFSSTLLLLITVVGLPLAVSAQGSWKAGVARVKITPTENIWQAGYAHRDKPASGAMHDLWAKALAIEDENGNKSLFVTSDILGFPKEVSDNIRKHFQDKFSLSKAQIILSSSHTHSGPVLTNALVDIYPMGESEKSKVDRYTTHLEKEVIRLGEQALRSLQPAKIYSGAGVTRFQVNRRNNTEAKVGELFELNGPSDHAVPVLKVLNNKNEVTAILFGYACHPTVLSEYEWSGDYPGFAQIELEKIYPGANAMFFLGSAGDQNPLPRRSVGLARQYGKELAAAVERVVEEPMRELAPTLSTAYSEIDLKLMPAPAKTELEKTASKSSGYIQKWAKRMLEKVNKGEKLMESYPYPVQVWMIGDQPVVSLGGEVTIEYTVKIKQLLGNDVFVAAYTNDVMGYIPSLTVWREGGYEGDSSQMVYGLPSKWEPSIESDILNEVFNLATRLGIQRK